MPRSLKKLFTAIPVIGPACRRVYQELRRRAELRRLGPAYAKWIAARLIERANSYPAPRENSAQFDIVTLTYETDPAVLRKTAASVFAQDYPLWRWIIWDNASSNPRTQAVLDELSRHPRVTVHRSKKNLGIAEGHAQALRLCEREYVALLDHDDMIYADALRIMAWHIDRHGRPDFLYSDEDKCDMRDRRSYPFFKPDISPAFLLDTGYTCHLSVVRREQLLASGAFSDKSVEGTQDWDMALRLIENGARTLHVPEVLYTWRAVPQSTAIKGVSAKPYVLQSHENCLQNALSRRGLEGRFLVKPNPLFPMPDGHWRITRISRTGGPLIDVVLVADDRSIDWKARLVSLVAATDYNNYRLRVINATGDDRLTEFCDEVRRQGLSVVCERIDHTATINRSQILNSLVTTSSTTQHGTIPKDLATASFIACAPDHACVTTPDWLWEAVTCFELHPDAAVVGGRTFGPKFEIVGGAALFGADGVVNVPYAGRNYAEPGFMCLNWTHRNVCAIYQAPWIARRAAIADVGGFDVQFPRVFTEVDFSARCHRAGWQVIYSPFIQAQGICRTPAEDVLRSEGDRLVERHMPLVRDDPYYSPFLSLSASTAYDIASPADRAASFHRVKRLRLDTGHDADNAGPSPRHYELFRHELKSRRS